MRLTGNSASAAHSGAARRSPGRALPEKALQVHHGPRGKPFRGRCRASPVFAESKAAPLPMLARAMRAIAVAARRHRQRFHTPIFTR